MVEGTLDNECAFSYTIRTSFRIQSNHHCFVTPPRTPLALHVNAFSVRTTLAIHETPHSVHLAIMRFMGDHSMSRGQTDLDCLLYLLKVCVRSSRPATDTDLFPQSMHKHRTLIDEILCQLIKQLTDNRSTKSDSVHSGWKLLVIILNYFIPSQHLRPYFVKYLNDNLDQNERLGISIARKVRNAAFDHP